MLRPVSKALQESAQVLDTSSQHPIQALCRPDTCVCVWRYRFGNARAFVNAAAASQLSGASTSSVATSSSAQQVHQGAAASKALEPRSVAELRGVSTLMCNSIHVLQSKFLL